MGNRALLHISLIAVILTILIFSITLILKGKFSTEFQAIRNTVDKIEKLEEKYKSKYIVDQMCYYNSDSLHPFQFGTIYRKSPLFVYLPKNTCWPCVLRVTVFLEEAKPEYLRDSSVVFISSVENIYYETLGKEIVMLKTLGLDDALEENQLFFFQLNQAGQITSLHIVANLEMERTREYILRIFEKR